MKGRTTLPTSTRNLCILRQGKRHKVAYTCVWHNALIVLGVLCRCRFLVSCCIFFRSPFSYSRAFKRITTVCLYISFVLIPKTLFSDRSNGIEFGLFNKSTNPDNEERSASNLIFSYCVNRLTCLPSRCPRWRVRFAPIRLWLRAFVAQHNAAMFTIKIV